MAAFAVALVMIPLVVAAAILSTVPSRGGGPTTGAADATQTATAAAAESTPPPTLAPSPTPAPTARPTPRRTPAPRRTTIEVGLLEPAEIVVRGEEVGTVTLRGFKHSTLDGDTVLVVKVQYEVTEEFRYSDDDWVARSDDGERYELAEEQLSPALGDGTLEEGDVESGFLTFDVPSQGAADRVIYRPKGASVVVEVDLAD